MAAPASPRDTSLPTRETPRKAGNRRTSLEIGVLGPLRVRLSGALLPVAGARRRGIVSALAMADGQPVTAERLAHVLLGDNGARANVATMRTYLSKLRAELGSAAERLQTVDGGYVLDLDADEFDVRRFRALLGAAGGASNPQLRLETADGALALWRGDPLVDLRDSAWGQAEIRALTSAWLEARKLRATAQLDLGDHVSVAAELEPVLAANPHREDLAGMLMVALYRSGRQAEALMLYPRLRDRIVSELGVEPGPALVDVHRAILRHDPALATGTGHAVTAIRQQPTPGPMPQRGVHRTTGRDQFPLAGREPELMLLETALHTAQQGRPGMILVTGEAGIGKSRLGQEFLALASTRGARVLTGLSLPAVLPYQPLVDCLSQYVEGLSDEQLLSALGRDGADLARIVPELADRLPGQAQPISPETGRRQLARAVAGWFRAASRDAPLVLLLDDLEQIDRETAELISSALPSAGMHPVLVVAVARDTDLGIDHPLHHLSAALRRQGMLNLLPLGPLPPDALATLAGVAGVDSRPDAVATLTADTGGNAFLATQALMALAAREPQAASSARAGIAELIRERLSQLPDSTVEALTAAAVAGGRVPLHHLAAILGLPVDETARRVAPAVAAHLLDEPSGGRYRFVHMLVRDALLDRLGPTLRAQAHRRLAEHLETMHADQPELVLDQLAHHHAAAVVADGDATKAVEFGLRAGVRAFEQFADEAALVRFRTAWEASCRGAPTSAELRRELLLRLGETEARLDRPTSYDTLLEAAAAAAAVGDNARVVRAALALARVRPHPGEPLDERRVAVLSAALETSPTGSERALLLAALAIEQTFVAPITVVRSLVDEAIECAGSGDDAVLARVLASTPWVRLATADPDDLMAGSAVHLEVARRLRDPAAVFDATSHRVLAALTTGDAAAIDDSVSELVRLAHEMGSADRSWQALTYQAIQTLQQGDLSAAHRAVDEASVVAGEHAITEGRASRAALLFGIRFEEGRLGELVDELHAVADTAPALSIFRAAALLAAAESGRAGEVQRSLTDVVDALQHEPAGWFTLPALAFYAQAASQHQHVAVARPLLDRLATYRPQFVFGGGAVWGHLHHHMGTLAALLDKPQAHWLLASAEDAHTRAGARIWAERSRQALERG